MRVHLNGFERTISRLVIAIAACVPASGALAQQAGERVQIAGQSLLPQDLSPWGMFLGADTVVKGVLIGLVAASVATWTVALVKAVELTAARRSLARGHCSAAAAPGHSAGSRTGGARCWGACPADRVSRCGESNVRADRTLTTRAD